MNKSAERERRILDFMKKEVETKGYPPTVREICDALGIKSTSTVHKDIGNLVKQGYLKKDTSKPRALMIVPKEDDNLSMNQPSTPDNNYQHVSEEIVELPVVGRIAAGTPITAVENIDDTIPIPARFVKGESYMLKVVGESMINVGIMDGDMIIVEKTNTARNGEIVVAMVDGFESEATVKTFYKEDGHIRLQPENDNMSPIIVRDVTILGKVKGVFRFFS